MEMNHTPTPWKVESIRTSGTGKKSVFTKCLIAEADQKIIANMFRAHNETCKIDAAFIVRAVNAYERDQEIINELLATVKALHRDKWWERPQEEHDALCNSRIRQAIAKAEEK